MAGAQGLDLRRPLKTSAALEAVFTAIRTRVARLEADRYMAGDLEAMAAGVLDGTFNPATELWQ